MDLSTPALPTSWYIGEGFADLAKAVSNFWDGIVTSAAKLLQNYTDWVFSQLKKVNIFGVNLGEWLDDDPIGALAGIGATLTAGGLVVVLNGKKALLTGGIKVIWDIAKSTVKIGKIPGLGGMIRAGVGATQRIWNFNWNISDKGIRETQKNSLAGLGGIWGEALGSMVGTLCGFSLGRIGYSNQAKLLRFNPEMIAKLDELRINDFDEESELWEEAVENLRAAMNRTASVALNMAALEGFLNVRKVIKAVARGVNLSAIFPSVGKMIEKWGEEDSKPWSFASAQEDFVESLPEGWFKNFTEEFLESAQDMCAESTIQASYAF